MVSMEDLYCFNEVKEAFERCKRDYNIEFSAKELQLKLALSVLNKKDCIGVLPTGYGKTLSYVIPTMILEEEGQHPITLVISPLTVLIDDQIRTLQEWNISCAKIGDETDKTTIKGRSVEILDDRY